MLGVYFSWFPVSVSKVIFSKSIKKSRKSCICCRLSIYSLVKYMTNFYESTGKFAGIPSLFRAFG